MKILITGAKGQLGRSLQERLNTQPGVELLACDRELLDISSDADVASCLTRHRPDLLINAAAYTAVDQAESDQENAYKINATGPGILAKHCDRLGIPLTHISTDFVFDGSNTTPYREAASCRALSVYGQTKLEGEQLVRERHPQSLIVRTSWVFSRHGGNFVKTMLRLMSERESLRIVGDQRGCPTSAGDLADAVIALSYKAINDPSLYGTYHFCNQGETSWYLFARTILQQATELGLIKNDCSLHSIATAEYPTAAERPAYSVLDTQKLSLALAESPRPWPDALYTLLTELKDSLDG